MTACPTCSGATDVPDGKGGIKPCPECQTPMWQQVGPYIGTIIRGARAG